MSSLKEDGARFQLLYDLYRESIYWYLYFRLGRDHDRAEDAVHDVFEKAWKSFSRFRERASLKKSKQWLFQIATHHAIDWYRRSQVIDWNSLDVLDTNPATFADDPQKAFGDGELVHQVLRTMEDDDRDVLILHIMHGFTLKEVAKILDIKQTAIKMRLSRARKKFRDVYTNLERRK